MKKLRPLAFILMGLLLLVSAGNLAFRLLDYRRGAEIYGEAQELAKVPDLSALPTPDPLPTPGEDPISPPSESREPASAPGESGTPAPTPYVDPYAEALSTMDFAALREVNGEVVGWVIIPGTPISYPLLQAEDNRFYLDHTWKGSRNAYGAIFMEHTGSPDLTDFHTILYGHNARNGSMFGSLQSYRDRSYAQAHPSVYVTVDSGTCRYDVFAVYQADVDSSTYQIGFSGEESRQSFLEDCLSRSLVDTGVTPHTYDRILTLSTCTNTGGAAVRWVVQAVCHGEEPAPEPTEISEGPIETPEPEDEALLPPGI